MGDIKPLTESQVRSLTRLAPDQQLIAEGCLVRSGCIYQYAGVPPEMYADLLAAESVVRFVAQVVRDGRKGVKIDGSM